MRATGRHLGHGIEPQFAMNVALAAIVLAEGQLFPSFDSSGFERAMDAPLRQIAVTSVGAYSYGTGAGASGNVVVAVLHLRPTGAVGTTELQLANPLLTDVAANPLTPMTQGATLVLPTRQFLPSIRR